MVESRTGKGLRPTLTVEKKSCARSGSPSSTASVKSGNSVITCCAWKCTTTHTKTRHHGAVDHKWNRAPSFNLAIVSRDSIGLHVPGRGFRRPSIAKPCTELHHFLRCISMDVSQMSYSASDWAGLRGLHGNDHSVHNLPPHAIMLTGMYIGTSTMLTGYRRIEILYIAITLNTPSRDLHDRHCAVAVRT